MIEIIRTLFKPVSVYTLGAYRGKHVLENKIGRYVSEEEFIKLMTDLGYKMNSRNQFKLAEYKPILLLPPVKSNKAIKDLRNELQNIINIATPLDCIKITHNDMHMNEMNEKELQLTIQEILVNIHTPPDV